MHKHIACKPVLAVVLAILSSAVAQTESETFRNWSYLGFDFLSSIRALEETPLDDYLVLEFECSGDTLSAYINGVEDVIFEDPDDVGIRVSTDDGVRTILLEPNSDEEPGTLVIDPNPTNLKTWINVISDNELSFEGMKVEVTIDYFSRVHEFMVSGFDEALAKLPCSSTFLQSLESWQLDQADGDYWSLQDGFVASNDPEVDNPGTLIVGKVEDEIVIALSPDMDFEKESVSVRHTFDEYDDYILPTETNWSVNELAEGVQILIAPQSFIDTFLNQARDGGYVELDILEGETSIAHRMFFFDGFYDTFEQLE